VKAHLDVLRNNAGLNPCNPMSSSMYKLMQHISTSTLTSSNRKRARKLMIEREREKEGRKQEDVYAKFRNHMRGSRKHNCHAMSRSYMNGQ
jgi:hypothetical protein